QAARNFHVGGLLIPGNRHVDAAAFLGVVITDHGVVQIGRHHQCRHAPHNSGERKDGQEPEPGLTVPGRYSCVISHYFTVSMLIECPVCTTTSVVLDRQTGFQFPATETDRSATWRGNGWCYWIPSGIPVVHQQRWAAPDSRRWSRKYGLP